MIKSLESVSVGGPECPAPVITRRVIGGQDTSHRFLQKPPQKPLAGPGAGDGGGRVRPLCTLGSALPEHFLFLPGGAPTSSVRLWTLAEHSAWEAVRVQYMGKWAGA